MTPDAATPAPEGGSIHDPQWQSEFFNRKRLERARIPARFMQKTLATFKPTGAIRKNLLRDARRYAMAFSLKDNALATRGLLMIGPVGCGKTHLAIAVLQEVIGKGYTGLYYNSPNLLRDLRATMDKENFTTEDELLEEVTTTDLLVFDDVGAEKSSEYVLDRFYLIINERYEAGKPVIITTNLDHEGLENRLGERIVSRMLEMCQTFGKFPDEDWRKKNLH